MDDILKAFDTESISEAGAWLHLTLPGTDGVPAYLDEEKTKPMRIKLKGPDCDIWMAFQRKAIASMGAKDKRTAKEIAQEDSRLFGRMTLEVENIPGLDVLTVDSATALYLKYKDIRMQALQFVLDRERNFISRPASD